MIRRDDFFRYHIARHQGVMRRMREQMNALLNHFGSSNGTVTEVENFSGFGLPGIPDLDLGKGNTTSVTKVIDGHKVVINETKYSNENANGGAFFKVRVIEVKPENENAPGVPPRTIPRDVEPLENSQENEISKQAGSEARYGNLEPLDDVDYTLPSKIVPFNNRWGNLEDFDEENRIDGPLVQPLRRPYDLSNDINVNYILAKKNYPINPDSEFIGSRNAIEPIPKERDLSRDIWVNQLMADQPYELNPDAEILDQKQPKMFEKFINPR
ncbi:uncharacterized protein LOC123309480 isoform X2 [Coccinella septempunctata]|uniref:uncharacterized protein LOC123309480 isoform X2 n=1 Tax=Coccinella septempunctata TaxID=41139 RepID=UPI001D062A40|nr:uncharacterized protein LOC123309480 isoform X2 [Coccinella septempunctata]